MGRFSQHGGAHSIGLCQLSAEPLVVLPQPADVLAVAPHGGLRALIRGASVALWWTH